VRFVGKPESDEAGHDAATDEAPRKSQETRDRIVRAALDAFATHGFEGASTRQIAALAGENQGLITYHFSSKENLWKAAADSIFLEFRSELEARDAILVDADIHTRIRLLLIYFVRYAARRPEQMRLMIQEGKADSPRMKWLVDRHIRPMFEKLLSPLVVAGMEAGALPEAPPIHHLYMMVGAASLLFASAPEYKYLTGNDPLDPATVEAHAEAVVKLVLRA
jgi:TetR/AcrR family transcriptional regulator